jgi:hypothetical protein
MAFAAANLYNINSDPPGFAKYTYKSDTDTRATVEAAGYFNNSDDLLNLAADDEIKVIGDQGGYTLKVVSVTAGSVTTTGASIVAGGSSLTLTQQLHDGKTILFDTAAGTTLTLPAATGSGTKIRAVVSVLATSNSHVIQCVGTDMMQGACGIVDTDSGDATIQFAALVGDTFDTITMNRTTSGLAAPGDWVELEDVVSGVWAVRGVIRASGVVITPFSSAV